MSAVVDRESLLGEIARLRREVDDLRDENKTLRAAMTPAVSFPALWKLTPSEARLLHVLHRAKGRLTTKRRILTAMHGAEVDVGDQVVNVMVSRMRRKLAPFGIEIVAQWGSGFGLAAGSLDVLAATLEAQPLAA